MEAAQRVLSYIDLYMLRPELAAQVCRWCRDRKGEERLRQAIRQRGYAERVVSELCLIAHRREPDLLAAVLSVWEIQV